MKIPLVLLLAVLLGGGAGAALAFWSIGPVAPVEVVVGGADSPLPAGGATGAAPAAAGVPVAVVDEPEHQFGALVQGGKSSHEFVVRNEGNAPLVLAVGKTSCKCTLGDVADDPIPPGGSAPVLVEWKAKTLPGSFRQLATIKTNDPLHPVLELTVEGQIVAAQGVVPQLFDMGVVDVDQGGEAVVHVVAFERDDLQVTAAMADSTQRPEQFSVTVESIDPLMAPLADAKAAVKILVQSDAGMPIGPINEWVKVTTNLNDGEEVLLPVTGQTRGAITMRGSLWSKESGVLNLGVVDGREGRETKVLLYCRGPHAAEVQYEVESVDPPELKVEIGERRDVREGLTLTPLRVAVPPGTRPMVRIEKDVTGRAIDAIPSDGDGVIRLKCNHPTSPEIRVPVRFLVQG